MLINCLGLENIHINLNWFMWLTILLIYPKEICSKLT